MAQAALQQPPIEPRENLAFGLDETLPKYWFDNDPFKTRLMDGMQLGFPEGERYFITSVRAFRDRITDPKQLQDVKDFTRQEGQHGIAHTVFNKLLEKQGLPIARLLAEHNAVLKGYQTRFSPEFNLALTAAFEHFTALMAEAFFGRAEVMAGVDKRMKSLFAWHAIEEMEHRSVAFDVMKRVAKVGYFKRVAAMAYGTWQTMAVMLGNADKLLEADGFSRQERRAMFIRNLGWMYGRNGVLSAFTPQLLAYFKPGFHPEDIPVMHNYGAWVDAYQRNQDPMEACDALMAAAR